MIRTCISIAVTSEKLKAECEELGHSAFVVPLNTQFANRAAEMGAQLVICDLRDDESGFRAAKDAIRWHKLPAIVVSEAYDEAIDSKIGSSSISECVFRPFTTVELRPIIARTMTRHYREVEKLAQGILMARHRLTEDEAYKRLQEDASKSGATLYDLALRVIQSAEDEARRLEQNAKEPWGGSEVVIPGFGEGKLSGPKAGKSRK